jgi:transcriptional regulator with GAF, ATPase, and Fis domain
MSSGQKQIRRAIRQPDIVRIPSLDITKPNEIVEGGGIRLSNGRRLLFASKGMKKLLTGIRVYLPLVGDILLLAETGAGKEMMARLIHDMSRCTGEFVAVNCSALTEALFESEMFGHERGSFTGAVAGKKGFIEQAEGGTLFLDEFGDLTVPLQQKLLRAQQEREFRRVGSEKRVKFNVRIIAATNRNVGEMIRMGLFRHDLVYRFSMEFRIPPLRERPEDILLLANSLLEELISARGLPRFIFHLSAKNVLQHYDYPGNVRELAEIVRRSVGCTVLTTCEETDDGFIAPPEVVITGEVIESVIAEIQWKRPTPAESQAPSGYPNRETVAEMRERHCREWELRLLDVFRRCSGNLAVGAIELGISRQAFCNQLRRHNIRDCGDYS